MPKKVHATDDYSLLSFPENPKIFGVERKTTGKEKFIKNDPEGKETGDVYHSMLYIISPYYNFYTGEATESCSCLNWRTRRTRCVHLKKFFEMNPDEDKTKLPNIYEETTIHPAILSEKIANEQPHRSYLAAELERLVTKEYEENSKFREKLSPFIKRKKVLKKEKTLLENNQREGIIWLENKVREWAKKLES